MEWENNFYMVDCSRFGSVGASNSVKKGTVSSFCDKCEVTPDQKLFLLKTVDEYTLLENFMINARLLPIKNDSYKKPILVMKKIQA